jgi:hypothetical protein
MVDFTGKSIPVTGFAKEAVFSLLPFVENEYSQWRE